MLFDSHAHLNSERYTKDGDREEVCRRIVEGGVSYIMDVGFDLESSLAATEHAARYDWCYAAVGCHPHDVEEMDEDVLSMFKALAKKPKVQAIGEIGLDYYRDLSPRDLQQEWFRRQIRLAKELDMPIIIHDRDAHEDVMRILKEEEAFKTGVLLHCFSASAQLAEQYVKLGCYISVAGPVTFKNANKLTEVARTVPDERLLIETDAPYLTPEPFRGKRNEPAYVRCTADKIAEIRGVTYEEIAAMTTQNAKRFFRIR